MLICIQNLKLYLKSSVRHRIEIDLSNDYVLLKLFLMYDYLKILVFHSS